MTRRTSALYRTYAIWIALLIGAVSFIPSAALAQAVSGTVLDSLGGAITGARVSIEGSNAATITDDGGAFRFQRVSPGTITLNVRRLGYRQRSVTVESGGPGATGIVIRLVAVPELLPTVEVVRKPEVFEARLAGFNARRERRVGHFITRDQLDRHDSPRFADALRAVPGVVVRPLRGSGGGRTVAIRGNCSPLVFFDGFPAASGPVDLDMIDLASVEGIEVYSGLATVPPEFRSIQGTERCGVIAIWSRPFRPRPRRLAEARAGELDRAVASPTVYTAAEVDEPAILVPGSVEPAYPDTLWQAGLSGRVVAEFIVGADGVIEQGTFSVASTTHPYFSAAVRSALETAIFRSAKLAGKGVRQLVQVPFVFDRTQLAPGQESQPDGSHP
ncbi:MAG: TonB-dependent receptor plug domain-containing protein [Gemmatimonadaceae bacterium]|nr:TonB-dependent receptor plug domain-containing protein [Gemmatimonadaceae bacterium]